MFRGGRRAALLTAVAAMALARGALAQTLPAADPTVVNEVVVTTSRLNLIGVAATASQGSITQKELQLRPIYRPGQLLETTPGLVVTAHSGEGKANQYLVRGFNLDHGTDIANFIDDMPVNRPSNAHGQGYSDVNFYIPELAEGLDFTKGPYYAAVGDFGSVASTHLRLLNEIPNQLSVTGGTLGIYNVLAAGTHRFSDDDRLLAGLYYGHVDGPFDHPDNFRKVTGELRYSHGTGVDGYSANLMYYKGDGNFTTDQPLRAIEDGLISRFGTLDPTDGSTSERISLSAHYAKTGEHWKFSSAAYYIHARMTLWNDFTHFLDDPVNGDQEQQDEVRDTFGGQASVILYNQFGPFQSDTVVGLQARGDTVYLDRRHTVKRVVLPYCSQLQADGAVLATPAPTGACNADRVHLLDLGPYVENTTYWTPWLRTIVGVREEYYHAQDTSFTTGFSGTASQTLFQPKASIALGPFYKTEVYVSAGRGFHSDDVRGVFGTVPAEGLAQAAGPTPLLAASNGSEVGLRTSIVPRLDLQVALFQEDFKSELAYNADSGSDSASAPSHRQGVEVSAEFKPYRWIEFNTDLAFSKARYTGDLADFGLSGPFIANAPSFIGSFGILVDNLGPWFGGLQWRDLGPYPISDGEENPQDKGYSEFNVDIGYKVNKHLKLQATIFNLTNTKANSAAFYYASRLPGEPAEGINDFQVHPLEPISGTLKATWVF
ncbi:MAG: TonB-dependent receptor [Caulobacteraceae bacterium]|nr:TonB-dependent receptor [Caulobacteraceae bacterium]